MERRRLRHGAAAHTAMAGAATAFLASLTPQARQRAVFAFGDKERLNWHYVPRSRESVAFKAMSAASRTAAHELMNARRPLRARPPARARVSGADVG